MNTQTAVNPAVQITPDTKISELLDNFPRLEDKLLEMSEAFAKLKNPFLRKTIAKVTSLRQAAKIAEIPLGVLINIFRDEADMDPLHIESGSGTENSGNAPAWLDKTKIIKTLDAREMLENGEHPLNIVAEETASMNPGEIYKLTTPFLPAPLIDVMKSKGCETWSDKAGDNLYHNYFQK